MKIAFFNSEGLYDVITYFTEQLTAALEKLGIECKIYNAYNGQLAEFIEDLDDPPDLTCAITGKTCFNQDFFSGQTHIPHIAFCMDAPIYYFKLFNNPYNLLTFIDRSAFELVPHKNQAFFLSLAADGQLANWPATNPCFDVLLIGACFDYESIREQWLTKLPGPLVKVMENAVEMVFCPCPPSFPEAILAGLNELGLEPSQVDFLDMCRNLENYMRGKDRLELLKSIKDAQIVIFGPHRFGPKRWSDYLGIFPNVTLFEGSVSYTKTFEFIRRGKIFLNSCPSIKDGAHERVFNGSLLGSLVLSNETPYYREYFQDGESILFYQPGKWQGINEKIMYYLTQESVRKRIVEQAREVVLNHHTWDHRAQELLRLLNYVSK